MCYIYQGASSDFRFKSEFPNLMISSKCWHQKPMKNHSCRCLSRSMRCGCRLSLSTWLRRCISGSRASSGFISYLRLSALYVTSSASLSNSQDSANLKVMTLVAETSGGNEDHYLRFSFLLHAEAQSAPTYVLCLMPSLLFEICIA